MFLGGYGVVVVQLVLVGLIGWRGMEVVSRAQEDELGYEGLERMWLHSQYNLNRGYEFEGNMVDRDLYTFAAMNYWQGGDPAVVNFETPPLGKYLIGVGYVLSGNMMLMQWVVLLGIGWVVWILGSMLEISQLGKLVVVGLVIYDPLCFEYAQYVHMEWVVLWFSLVGLMMLCVSGCRRREVVVFGMTAGVVAATKVFVLGTVFLGYGLMVMVIGGKRWKKLVLAAGATAGVYLGSYVVVLANYGLEGWLRLTVKVIRFYRSYLPEYPWFEIWRILLVGKWRTWFADPLIQPVKSFWWGWPVSVVLALWGGVKAWQLKQERWVKVYGILGGWAVVYLLFSSTHLVFVNYLITVLPILFLLAIKTG